MTSRNEIRVAHHPFPLWSILSFFVLVTAFVYSPTGNVSSQTDAAGAVMNYTYDALDRLLTRTYPADSSLNVSLTYDQGGHGKGIGQLTSATDQAGSLSLNYDERGLVTSNARTISGKTYTTGYTFESAGRLASVTYPTAGWAANYARDAAGQITGVTTIQPGQSAVSFSSAMTYLPFGPLTGRHDANGATETRTYDLDYRATQVKDMGTGVLMQMDYTYDAGDNVLTVTTNDGTNQTLTYDAVDRLKSAVGFYGTVSSITYDSNSNMLTYGGTTNTVPSNSDRMSVNGASSITYTSTGNISTYGSSSLTYNKANQLATSTFGGGSTGFAYDAFRQRLTETKSGATTVRQYNPSGNLLMKSTGGVETDYVWIGDMPIGTVAPGSATRYWILSDRLGTPHKMNNTSRANVWQAHYPPFGPPNVTQNNVPLDLRFPGQFVDGTGIFHNGFRDYAPKPASNTFGRYLQADPIGLAGGLNPYIYADNNPLKWTDPSGLACMGGPGRLCNAFNQLAEGGGARVSGGGGSYGVSLPEALGRILFRPTPATGPAQVPAPTPGVQCTVGQPTAGIAELLSPRGQPIGQAGSQPRIRVLPGGQSAAEDLFLRLTEGGTPNTPPSYPGVRYSLPNGGWVGYRPLSRSGPPTIDVNVNGVNISKLKFPQ